MDKDVVRRKEEQRDILYESVEPLFPERAITRKRLPIWMYVCAATALAVVIIACGIMGVSGDRGNEGATQTNRDSFESEMTDMGEDSSCESVAATESVEESVEELESRSDHVTGSPVTDGEESESVESVAESDMSEIERGESYVVNYSGLAIDAASMLDEGFTETEKKGMAAPIVMIIHTHTSEEYSECDDNGFKGICGVVSVGEKINAELNRLGLSSIHCTVIHDGGKVNPYIESRKTLQTMLDIYPSVKYVIDIHRIGGDDSDGVKSISALSTAQIRLTVGDGGAWQDSLSLALALRRGMNENESRLCMPVVLSSSKYNSDMSRYYLMVDVGTRWNDVSEALDAGTLFARALARVLINE